MEVSSSKSDRYTNYCQVFRQDPQSPTAYAELTNQLADWLYG